MQDDQPFATVEKFQYACTLLPFAVHQIQKGIGAQAKRKYCIVVYGVIQIVQQRSRSH